MNLKSPILWEFHLKLQAFLSGFMVHGRGFFCPLFLPGWEIGDTQAHMKHWKLFTTWACRCLEAWVFRCSWPLRRHTTGELDHVCCWRFFFRLLAMLRPTGPWWHTWGTFWAMEQILEVPWVLRGQWFRDPAGNPSAWPSHEVPLLP